MISHDKQPEDALLFAIMESREACQAALDAGVKSQHFFQGRKKLFEIITKRFNEGKSSKMADLGMLYPESQILPHLIDSVSHRPTPPINSVPDYVELIVEKAKRRHAKNLLGKNFNKLKKTDTSVDEVISSLRGEVDSFASLEATRAVGTDQWLTSVAKYTEKTRGREVLGFDAGFTELTHITSGIQKGSFWVVGGQTNIGKTQLCQQMMLAAAKDGAKALFISLELSKNEMGTRILSMITGKSLLTIKKTDLSEDMVFCAGRDELKKLDIYLEDGAFTIQEVLNSIILEKNRHDIDLVVVDYIQNISVEGKGTEYEALNATVLSLQKLALEKEIAIIAVSQLNRDTNMKKNSGLHHFKGSGNIENSADIAVSLFQDNEKVLWCAVNKNRLTGKKGSLPLERTFNGSKFMEGDKDGQGAIPSKEGSTQNFAQPKNNREK